VPGIMLGAFFRKKLMDMKKTKMKFTKLTLFTSLFFMNFGLVHAADQSINGIAAVVNSDIVLVSDVQQLAQRKRASGNQEESKALFQSSLDSLILEKLQLQEAKRVGINPSSNEVNKAISGIASRNNLNLAGFKQALAKEGISFDNFKQNIANQITLSTLKARRPQQQTEASEQDVEDLILSESQAISKGLSYNIQDILIPAPQPLAASNFNQASRTANQLRNLALKNTNFLNVKLANSKSSDLGWTDASKLSFAYLKELNTLEAGQVSNVIQDARGFHVLKLIDKRGGTNNKAFEVHVRHILISNNEQDAKNKAAILLRQLQQGADFATLAKINSADKVSALNGGDLGWGSSKKYVDAFSKTTETLALNTLSSLVKTQFGYHIIEVLDRKETNNSQKHFEEKARKELAARNKTSDYDAWVKSLRSNAFIDYRIKP